MDHLKQMLQTINVTYIERTFETATGASGLGTELFVSNYKDRMLKHFRACLRKLVTLLRFTFHLLLYALTSRVKMSCGPTPLFDAYNIISA